MKRRVLIAYDMGSSYVQTTFDYLSAFADGLEGDVAFLHVTRDSIQSVDLNDYDVVINNYCARLCSEGYVSMAFQNALSSYGGLKILSVQDEYNQTNILKAAIKRIGFDVVLTCVPQDSLEYVYPRSEFPSVRFETVFTGYAPERSQAAVPVRPLKDRFIEVGYRGRDIGGFYGRLGFEKFEIGRRMKEACDAAHIVNDIAMDEESRIYGEAWPRFISSCRSMLGSESGSNIFDFDGSIERQFMELEERQGHRPSYEEFKPYVEHLEDKISMGQVSPRIFECAIARTAMILFRGRYSDVLIADEHYVAVEKDFSNLASVLATIRDVDRLTAMADRAYEHLIASEKYGYRAFLKRINGIIEQEAPQHPKGSGSLLVSPAGESASERRTIWLPTPRPEHTSLFRKREAGRMAELYGREIEELTAVAEREVAKFRRIVLTLRRTLRLTMSRRHRPTAEASLANFENHIARFEVDRKDRRARSVQLRGEHAVSVELAASYLGEIQALYRELPELAKGYGKLIATLSVSRPYKVARYAASVVRHPYRVASDFTRKVLSRD